MSAADDHPRAAAFVQDVWERVTTDQEFMEVTETASMDELRSRVFLAATTRLDSDDVVEGGTNLLRFTEALRSLEEVVVAMTVNATMAALTERGMLPPPRG